MRADQARLDDVVTIDGSHFMVRRVSEYAFVNGVATRVALLLAAGRTDPGEEWTCPADADLDVYRSSARFKRADER